MNYGKWKARENDGLPEESRLEDTAYVWMGG